MHKYIGKEAIDNSQHCSTFRPIRNNKSKLVHSRITQSFIRCHISYALVVPTRSPIPVHRIRCLPGILPKVPYDVDDAVVVVVVVVGGGGGGVVDSRGIIRGVTWN